MSVDGIAQCQPNGLGNGQQEVYYNISGVPVVAWDNVLPTSPNGDVTIFHSTKVVIEENVTVTLCKNARIILLAGATLIVKGTITGHTGSWWRGIEVHGNPTVPHPSLSEVESGTYPSSSLGTAKYQQAVLIVDGGTIKNALNAITTSKQEYQGNSCCSGVGQYFSGYGYSGYNGGIVIGKNNAKFINNRRTLEMSRYFPDNISYFENCDFLFDINGNPPLAFKAFATMWDVHGVEFRDNYFQVGSSVSNENHRGIFSIDADYKFDNNQFYDLPRSIVAHDGKTTDGQITINGNNFSGTNLDANEKQVEWKAVSNGVYTNNKTFLKSDFADGKVGFYLEGCKGYEVTDNQFSGSSSRNHSGIYVIESGSGGEVIFRNPKFNLAYGILTEENNGGLQIKCNNFLQTSKNNVYSSGNLGNPQGFCPDPEIGPAGNQFSHPCEGSSIPYKDFYVKDATTFVNYNYHHSNINPAEPVDCQGGNILNIPCDYSSNAACNSPGFMPSRTSSCSSFPSCRGITINTLKTNISNVEQALLQETPNTPQYEALEMELSALKNHKGLLYHDLVREGIGLEQLATVMPILEQDNEQEVHKMRIELYLALKNYTEVSAELNSLVRTTNEDQLFYDYYTTLNALFSSGRTYFDMTTQEETIIRNVAASEFVVSKRAQNILEFVFEEVFSHTLQFPQTGSTSKTVVNDEIMSDRILTLSPNPANNRIHIRWNISPHNTSTAIQITDITGRLIKEIIPLIEESELWIDIKDIPNGMYLVSLLNGSHTQNTEKLLISK